MRHLSLVALTIAISLPATGGADSVSLVSPCRLLDTRNTSVGYVAAGSVLNFRVRNFPGGTQGGQSGCGCGGASEASGAILNLIAVAPAILGHASLWAYGTPQPVASVLNFDPASTTNDGLTAKFAAGGSTYDLSLVATSAAYFVVDVVGCIDPRPPYLVGTLSGIPASAQATVSRNGNVVATAIAPFGFEAEWDALTPGFMGQCVHIDGAWAPNGFFLATSLPFSQSAGPCG